MCFQELWPALSIDFLFRILDFYEFGDLVTDDRDKTCFELLKLNNAVQSTSKNDEPDISNFQNKKACTDFIENNLQVPPAPDRF